MQSPCSSRRELNRELLRLPFRVELVDAVSSFALNSIQYAYLFRPAAKDTLSGKNTLSPRHLADCRLQLLKLAVPPRRLPLLPVPQIAA